MHQVGQQQVDEHVQQQVEEQVQQQVGEQAQQQVEQQVEQQEITGHSVDVVGQRKPVARTRRT